MGGGAALRVAGSLPATQRRRGLLSEDSPFYDTLLLAMRHDGWDMPSPTDISGDAPIQQQQHHQQPINT